MNYEASVLELPFFNWYELLVKRSNEMVEWTEGKKKGYDRRNWYNYQGNINCSIGLSVGGEPVKTTVTFFVPIIASLNTVTIARNELSLLLVSLYHPASRPPPSKATIAFFGALNISIP